MTFDQAHKDLIAEHARGRGCNEQEVRAFVAFCEMRQISPVLNQVWVCERKSDGKIMRRPECTIDALRLAAERTGRYAPGKPTEYHYNEKNELIAATVSLRKQTDDKTWHEFSETAHWDEYAARKQDGTLFSTWQRMQHIMLGKCAGQRGDHRMVATVLRVRAVLVGVLGEFTAARSADRYFHRRAASPLSNSG